MGEDYAGEETIKTLIIGPAIGEFGWMLMAYNPYARYAAKKFGYERVVACVPRGTEHIWEFATDFEYVSVPNRADRWLIKDGRQIKIPKEILRKYPHADSIVPNEKNCTTPKREYVKFCGKDHFPHAIAIHARATKKYNQSDRNWPVKKFEKIVEIFSNFQICSVGTDAHHIPGTHDKRNLPLQDLCGLLNNTRVLIGPSSGPMHLAQLCGTPIIVWTHTKKEGAIGATNRRRYEDLWNPFKSRVVVIDKYGWSPSVRVVAKEIREILNG